MPNTWKMVQTPLRDMFQEELQAYEAKFVVSKNWAQNRLYIKAKAHKPVLKKSASNSPLAPKNKTSTNNFAKTLIVVDFCMAMLIGVILHSAWVEPIQSGVVKANISPVTFTKEELEAFFAPRKAEAKSIAVEKTTKTPKSEVEGLIRKHFGEHAEKAIKVAKCESGLNPNAKNKHSTASGVFQIIKGTWIGNRKAMGLDTDLSLRFNAEENIKTAKYIYDHRNWQPWECHNLGLAD